MFMHVSRVEATTLADHKLCVCTRELGHILFGLQIVMFTWTENDSRKWFVVISFSPHSTHTLSLSLSNTRTFCVSFRSILFCSSLTWNFVYASVCTHHLRSSKQAMRFDRMPETNAYIKSGVVFLLPKIMLNFLAYSSSSSPLLLLLFFKIYKYEF